ncbi:MAG: hypothetical protein HN580_10870 [Deltaproteobacteria bacterium]|jgi:hypothetical protein|nr:hypothetical protein [Deltaproteobacteria bacterium]MBT4091062.1 hypothetical protein [Deltaproteobacteria bacterium]MBT4263598.1 hypothetical protein [Deltaproteobacteria bacterium]MBT4644323.1 hypothetical protein [Deltaproteobacteria bacterium]MBT6500404.1 hypothetical protein [Deltaproteobacteria bacterium]
MPRFGIFKKLIFCLLFGSVLSAYPVVAKQEMHLAELNPEKTALGVFNSYKHKILLISLVQIHKPSFNCLPNQYLFYDYGTENYFEIHAGNLKISSDYTRIFLTRIHSLSGIHPKNKLEWKKALTMLSKALKVPFTLISAAQQKSLKFNRICWQQPELLNIQNRLIRSYSYLAANLCENEWCSELYWTGPKNIQFWIHEKPQTYQLVNLNIEKGITTVKTQSKKFVRTHMTQLNAPRENLINSESLAGKTLVLKKNKKNSVTLVWRKGKTGRVYVTLTREGHDLKAAQRVQNEFALQIKSKQVRHALQTAEFSLWLDPRNQNLKIERLKAFVSLALMSQFYDSLKTDFSKSDRFAVCQKLHLEPSIRHLWKKDAFVHRFKEICAP